MSTHIHTLHPALTPHPCRMLLFVTRFLLPRLVYLLQRCVCLVFQNTNKISVKAHFARVQRNGAKKIPRSTKQKVTHICLKEREMFKGSWFSHFIPYWSQCFVVTDHLCCALQKDDISLKSLDFLRKRWPQCLGSQHNFYNSSLGAPSMSGGIIIAFSGHCSGWMFQRFSDQSNYKGTAQ